MSLFNDLQWEIIEKPQNKWSYARIRKAKQEEIKTKKQIVREMKEKLSPEEFKKRYRRQYYDAEAEREKYQKKKAERDKFAEEIYAEMPEPINRDKYYTKKYRDDDTVKNWYRFAWRSSRLRWLNRKKVPKRKKPFRVSNRRWLEYWMRRLLDIQCDVYKYLKPHLEEIRDCKICLCKKQYPYDYPTYHLEEPLNSLCEASEINTWRIVNVAYWMVRDKFMVSELYLGRNSFIFWDVLVTWTWNTFRIALENNLPWLTKDTVEEIHSLRMDWRKNKGEKAPPIYIVNDAYLIKIPINERENLFYIVPT